MLLKRRLHHAPTPFFFYFFIFESTRLKDSVLDGCIRHAEMDQDSGRAWARPYLFFLFVVACGAVNRECWQGKFCDLMNGRR